MFGWFKRREVVTPGSNEVLAKGSLFSTHQNDTMRRSKATQTSESLIANLTRYLLAWAPKPPIPVGTGDDCEDSQGWNAIKSAYGMAQPNIPDAIFQWFGTQTYIGPQACAIVAQHWLVKKICLVPARDAIRQGFEIINEVGEDALDDEVVAEYAKYDKKFKLMKHLLNYAYNGRKFGIRVAVPIIDSPDPDFYEKPFNPDSVRPGSFKGWFMRDPYWMAPILSAEAAGDTSAPDFYEPTWWMINGKKYHRSHLCIFRTEQPDDILKPAYLYGGIPVPQAIMERVYAAERTANEAPLLAMTKRLYTLKIADIESMMLNKDKFDESMGFLQNARDNHGVYIAGADDDMQQLDTALTDLSDVIDNQYALACAAGDAPVNKIMGTAAGGLSSEGGYDQESYRETLESMQEHELTPFVERHHLLLKLSYIIPKFGRTRGGANTTISWMPLDAPTAKEYAEINELNARADLALSQTGAISDADINERLRNDKNSGYSTIRPIEEGEREPVGGDQPTNEPELGTPGKVTVSETASAPTGDAMETEIERLVSEAMRRHLPNTMRAFYGA
jgi:phage-related protein (TIGR01555 family)